MRDERKTKEALIGELEALRARVADLENSKPTADSARLERELHATQMHYTHFVESSSDVISYWKLPAGLRIDLPAEDQIEMLHRGVCVDINAAALQRAGLSSKEEAVGKRYDELAAGRNIDHLYATFIGNGYRLTGEEMHEAFPGVGDRYSIETWYGVVENGVLSHLWASSMDITARKIAENTLSDSERKFRAIFDQSVQLMGFCATDGTLLDVNATALDGFGVNRGEAVGEPLWETPWFNHSEGLQQHLSRAIAKATAGRVVSFDAIHFDSTGEPRTVEMYIAPIEDDDGTVVNVIVFGNDVTGRRRAEAEVLEISGRERQRIGQDLHDGLGQQLTGMRLLAGALELKLVEKGLEEAEDTRAIQELITESVEQTRFLARGLVQLQLDEIELAAALEELALRVNRMFGVRCETFVDPEVAIADEKTASHLYQIAREATTNAARHAQPTSVSIDLVWSNAGAVLTIADDGVGIRDSQLKNSGLGLRIMRYRSSLIGATLQIEPGPRCGTVVRCELGRPD